MSIFNKKPRYDFEGIQCRVCGFIYDKKLKECPRCKYRDPSPMILAK